MRRKRVGRRRDEEVDEEEKAKQGNDEKAKEVKKEKEKERKTILRIRKGRRGRVKERTLKSVLI